MNKHYKDHCTYIVVERKVDSDFVCRRVRESDFEDRFRMIGTPEVFNGLMIDIPISLEVTREWCKKAAIATDRFDFCLEYEGLISGFGGLVNLDRRSRVAELYIFVTPERHGQGIGHRFLEHLLSHAKFELNLRKITLYVSEGNEAAVRFYERNGFSLEGRLQKHSWHRGQYKDRLVYSIFLSDFLGERQAFYGQLG